MAYTAWSVVFGEQPSASKFNILGTNDAGFRDGSNFAWGASAVLTGGPAWTSYTPVFAGITVGSGSVAGSWKQLGKDGFFRASFTYGAGSAVAATTVSLPFTSVSLDTKQPIGQVIFNDSDTSHYLGTLHWTTTTTATIRAQTVIGGAGTYVRLDPISSTVPFTFASGDEIHVDGHCEVA